MRVYHIQTNINSKDIFDVSEIEISTKNNDYFHDNKNKILKGFDVDSFECPRAFTSDSEKIPELKKKLIECAIEWQNEQVKIHSKKAVELIEKLEELKCQK